MNAESESNVNHPSHYAGDNAVECIDFIRKYVSDEAAIYFSIGNTIKYLWRRTDKNPDKEDEDVAKALWYFDEAKKIVNGSISFDINREIKMRDSLGVKK